MMMIIIHDKFKLYMSLLSLTLDKLIMKYHRDETSFLLLGDVAPP